MIRTIEISDYRSILSTKMELQPDLSVFIGPNGSGKTNILSSILLLSTLAKDSEYRPYPLDRVSEFTKIKVRFQVNTKTIILTAKVNLDNDDENKDVVFASDQSWYAKDITGSSKRYKIPIAAAEFLDFEGLFRETAIMLRSKSRRAQRMISKDSRALEPELIESFQAIQSFLQGIRYYSASQFTNPSLCPVSFEVEQDGSERRRSFTRRRYPHDKFLSDLYQARDSDTYAEFFDVIGSKGIGLIDGIEFKEIPTSSIEYTVRSGGEITQRKREKILVVPQFRIGNNELSPSQLSEGTFKTITLLFYLMTEDSRMLLIEEPEVCVHHGLLSSIVELIKIYSEQKQILISTHSDFILDHVEPRNVYRVNRHSENGTEVFQIARTMSRKDYSALKKYLRHEGNLGEYWRHGGLD